MNYLNFSIQFNKAKYDDFKKESHPGKTLRQHIEEIYQIGSAILNIYNLDKKHACILEYLAFTHDLGKLHKDWQWSSEKRPSHADASIRIIAEYQFKFENKLLQAILFLFILKHHGILKKQSFNCTNKKLREDIDRIQYNSYLEQRLSDSINELSINERIDLVDTFGIFKQSDSLSAGLKQSDPIEKIRHLFGRPILDINKLKQNLGIIDQERWRQQKKLIDACGTTILQAPTGWGKTTTALLFAAQKNKQKIFFVLPTITAIRRLKDNLTNILGKDTVDAYFSFFEVDKNLDETTVIDEIYEVQNFMRPIIITTIDQILLTFLQSGKYHLKRFSFRNSLIIVDEIHLLNPIMLDLFTKLMLKFEEVYNIELLFMSATMSKGLSDYLIKHFNISQADILNFTDSNKLKKRIKYNLEDSDIVEHIEDAVALSKNGKKVLILVNTVDKAITIGKTILEKLKFDNAIVFHSRFIYKHRLEKETLIEKFKSIPHILISTQVAEVSLDISYDVLFTELAPFSSIIQRFGRVNRFGKYINCRNVVIYTPTEASVPGKKYPYTEGEMNLARTILSKYSDDKLQNEYQLFEEFNNLESIDTLESFIMSETQNSMNFKAWEDILQYFYALTPTEDQLLIQLSYRESITTQVLLQPQLYENEKQRLQMEQLIQDLRFPAKNYTSRMKIKQKIKEMTISVPIWMAKGAMSNNGLPLISIDGYRYNDKYGLYKLKGEDFII